MWKFIEDWLGITDLKETIVNDEATIANQKAFIAAVDKDTATLAQQNVDLTATVAGLKGLVAQCYVDPPTTLPVFLDPTAYCYKPNVEVLNPDESVDSISFTDPRGIYTRSDFLNSSIGISSLLLLTKYQKLAAIWAYVINALTYVSDYGDNWQTSNVTVVRKKGDCEDGSILFVDCARAVGIEANQVFNAVGNTNFGYHSYPIVFLSADDVKGTPVESSGAGFYIYESTLDVVPAAPKPLNGSVYWADGGLQNWAYAGAIKKSSASLFNGIYMPGTGSSIDVRRKIDRGDEKIKRIREHWRVK